MRWYCAALMIGNDDQTTISEMTSVRTDATRKTIRLPAGDSRSGRMVMAMLRLCTVAITTPPAIIQGKRIAWMS